MRWYGVPAIFSTLNLNNLLIHNLFSNFKNPLLGLSDLFLVNRDLLNQLPALAAKILKKLAKKKGITPGLFMALHTFGRKLNWHVSITRGGMTTGDQWKTLFFKKTLLMKMWRHTLITWLRKLNVNGQLNRWPELGNQSLTTVLSQQYAKFWQVHCTKPNNNPKKDLEYLGRYIKRQLIELACMQQDNHDLYQYFSLFIISLISRKSKALHFLLF